jgi:hypothetical protein
LFRKKRSDFVDFILQLSLPLITERVLKVVKEFHDVQDPNAVTINSHLQNDLKLDSLSCAELIMHIEGLRFFFPHHEPI